MATITQESAVRAPAVAGIADPGPLGLAAFALTTFILSSFNADLLPAAVEGVVLGPALFYGGAVQVLAGMWEFVKNNTFGALAFSSYGAFWMSLWYWIVQVAPKLPASPDKGHALGLFLLAWTIFTLYMTVAASGTNGALFGVFVILLLTFALLTIGALGDNPTAHRIGGWTGILTAFAAWYVSAAGIINSSLKRTMLPVFPRH